VKRKIKVHSDFNLLHSIEDILSIILPVVIGFMCVVFVSKGLHLQLVMGNSMKPTLHNFSIVQTTTSGELKRNDIIILDNKVYKGKSIDYIKRIIGMPGETIQIKDNKVYINDSPLDEPYETTYAGVYKDPVTLGKDEYVVLGDNRQASLDGRYFGVIKKHEITRKVTKILF
jgi:signal peptidase I